jgi:hypothetical protein
VRQLLNALAKISGRIGIAELAAQLSGCLCVIDREPADGDGYSVRLRGGNHLGIIARLPSHFHLKQDDRTLRDRNFKKGFVIVTCSVPSSVDAETWHGCADAYALLLQKSPAIPAIRIYLTTLQPTQYTGMNA